MTSVTLYTKADCHLCDSAREVIENLRSEFEFQLEQVDITCDESLNDLYRERIPVVAVEGEEVAAIFVRAEALRSALRGAASRATIR
jgi:glutaredoxin